LFAIRGSIVIVCRLKTPAYSVTGRGNPPGQLFFTKVLLRVNIKGAKYESGAAEKTE